MNRARKTNWEWPTLGGKQLWTDIVVHAGYRVQQNALTGHCRLLNPQDRRLAFGSFTHCNDALSRRPASWRSPHLVVLLHGIFRSKDSLSPMYRYLRSSGLEAVALNYASTQRDVAHHASNVAHVLDALRGIDTVSFVCHSMGGLVARTVLAREDAWQRRIAVNRLVMIATPNQGASFARLLGEYSLFRAIAGPATQDLVDTQTRIPRPRVRFGVVVAVRGSRQGFNPLLAGDDDFTVTAREAQLEGAEDTLFVESFHTVVMRQPTVIRATECYLRSGRFRR